MNESHPEDRVLLLMTTKTYRASAFLDAAAKLDIPIAVGTQEKHLLADLNPAGNLQIDFHDLEGSTDLIVQFAGEYPLKAVVSTDDDGVVLAAMASDALGLSHSSLLSVRAARDKYQTRRALEAAEMRTPGYQLLSVEDDPTAVAEHVRYPCVVKPIALAASRGVMRTNDRAEFVEAFSRLASILDEVEHDEGALAGDQILVEDYIPGIEVALEGMLIDGELLVLAIFDKPDPLEGPFFEETIYVTPSRHSVEVQESIVSTTRDAVSALGLTQGPIHAEMRVNDEGVWIIEVAPRSIGGYCSRALRFQGGVGLEELILERALGHSMPSSKPATPASGVMMIPIPQGGILCGIRNLDQAKSVSGIDEIRLTIPVGQAVVPLPEGSQYLGFIFSRAEDPLAAELALREAHSRLKFVILPPEDAESYDWQSEGEQEPSAQNPYN